jgi:hypothetical protein
MQFCICASGGASRRGQGSFGPEANDELRGREVIGAWGEGWLRLQEVIGARANDGLRGRGMIGGQAEDGLRVQEVIGARGNGWLRGWATIQPQDLREGDEFAGVVCPSGVIISWTSRHEFRIFRAP